MKHLFLILFSWFQMQSAWAENKLLVQKVENTTEPTGLIYSLPKTVVGIDVTIKKTKVKIGKFAADTDKFFDLKASDDYPIKPSTAFATDTATFKTRQIADSNELYRVMLTDEWMKDHHFNLELAEDGTLSKGEATVTNKRVDFFLSILGTVASIAGKFVGAAALTANNSTTNKSLEGLRDECDAAVAQLAFNPGQAAATSPEAKHAFCEIVKLLQRRQNIVLGTNTLVSGTDTLLQDIDLQLKKHFTENFTGSKTESTWTARFEHVPSNAPSLSLFTFAENCGVSKPVGNWIDTRVGDGFEDSAGCSDKGPIHTVYLNYAINPNGSIHSRFNNTKPAVHSFAFRIPAAYQAAVTDSYTTLAKPRVPAVAKQDTVAKGDLTIAHLGVIGYMPAVVG